MENHVLYELSPGSIVAITPREARSVVSDLLGGRLRVSARAEHEGQSIVLLDERRAKPFSARECAIVARTAQGALGKVIAIELGITPSTVSARLGWLLGTIGVSSRAELASIAVLAEARLVPPSDSGPSWTTVTQGVARVEVGDEPRLVASFSLFDAERMQRLTPAERDVVRAAVSGKTNLEIARARRTSPNTVADQLAHVYRKLNVGSRWALAGYPPGGFFSPPPF
jgi:DNA-binding NarL/FixJ family response regulator